MSGKAGGSFASGHNGSKMKFVDPKCVLAVRTVEDFIEALRMIKALCPVQIGWGNHREQFAEIPTEMMHLYLKHRKKLFHADALKRAQEEYAFLKNHPWVK